MPPHRWKPTRLPRPWDSPGKNTGVGCHFLLQCVKVKSESEVTQSCLTLNNPMDCSPPGSSVRGIFQARVLEWGAIAFSKGSSIPLFITYKCVLMKQAEHRRTDAFILWGWRRLLRVPWTERRSNQSIQKEINLEYSLQGLVLKLKLQYFGHLMQRVDSLEKTLILGKIEGRRRRGRQDEVVRYHHWLKGHEFEHNPRDSEGQGRLVCCSPWGRKELSMTEQLNNKWVCPWCQI